MVKEKKHGGGGGSNSARRPRWVMLIWGCSGCADLGCTHLMVDGLYVTTICRGLSYLFLSYLFHGLNFFLQRVFLGCQGNGMQVFLF